MLRKNRTSVSELLFVERLFLSVPIQCSPCVYLLAYILAEHMKQSTAVKTQRRDRFIQAGRA